MESDLPVLVQFQADWCPYCRATQPALLALYQARKEALRVFKVDTDHDPELAVRYQVDSIPTFVLLHHGKIIAQSAKVLKGQALAAWVDKGLNVPILSEGLPFQE